MKKRIFTILLSVIVAIFAISGIAYGIHKYNQTHPKDKSTDTVAADETPTPTPEKDYGIDANDPLKDLKLSLIVDLDRQTLEEMYSGYSQEFLDSSMPNRSGERTLAASTVGWGKEGYHMYDAVSFPFSTVQKGKTEYTEADIDTMLDELREEIMRNPVVLDMFLQGMKEMSLTDNTTVAELNEDWVEDFLTIYDEHGCGAYVTYHTMYWSKYGYELPHDGEDVDAWRAEHPNAPEPTTEDLELIPLDDDEELTPATTITGAYGRYGQVEKPRGVYKLFVTDYYVRTAKRALAWLDRCTVVGVDTYATTKHWVLNSTQNANKVRTHMNEDKTYVDKQPALVFAVITKNEQKQVLFGFNIYDMRFELFERTSQPVKPDPDPQPRPKPDPDPDPRPDPDPDPDPVPDPDPDPNPDPDPDPNPDPDPTPDPDPQKDPSQDPVHDDNADKGGGEGQGETGDPTPDPSLRDMEDAHGGEDNNQGHSDPDTVKPVDPDPGPGHSDIDNTDSNPDDYGEENHDQHDSVTDDNGNESIPDNQPSGGEFEEPDI